MEKLKIKTSYDLKIASLGYGNMMKGVMQTLFEQKILDKNKYTAVVGRPESRENLLYEGMKATLDHQILNQENFDVIFIGYKQKNFWEEKINQKYEGIVVSIIAGIESEDIQKKYPQAKVVRAMPNRGSVVGSGCTFLQFSDKISSEEKSLLKEIFNGSGDVYEIETAEEMNKGTILSASMLGVIAFFRDQVQNVLEIKEENPKSREFFAEFAQIVEKLTKKYNFLPEKGKVIAEKTFEGVEKLHHRTGEISKNKYSYIQASVTSPNGTTHAMIEYLKSVGIEKFLENIFQTESRLEQEKQEKFADFLEQSYLAGIKRAEELAKK